MQVYDELIRELERVPDDARDAVASFLQDLRRDGVDWYRVGDGGEFDDKESFFRTVHAGACMRAARIHGFRMFEVRARARGAVGRVDVRVCRHEWKSGLFEVRARERVSLGRGTCDCAA